MPDLLTRFRPVTHHVFSLAAVALATALPAIAQTSSPPLTLGTLAGQAGASGSIDGAGAVARFLNPSGLACDSRGNLFVADTGNNTIRKITPAGVVTTFAGTAVDSISGIHNNGGTADATGGAAEFSFGKSIIDSIGSNTLAIDASDNVYVADTLNNSIRKVTAAAVVSTLQLKDNSGSAVTLNSPDGVAVDSDGNLYVADSGNNVIRKITPGGLTTVLAGRAGLGGSGSADGTGTAASFNNPRGIAIDSWGNIYVSDSNNNTIRKITPAGVVTTFAGSPGTSFRTSAGSSDGFCPNARFNSPVGLAFDSADNLYVADKGNSSVRKITTAGVVSTVAGLSGSPGSADGTGNMVRVRQPYAVAADAFGNVYVADTKNHVVRKGASSLSAPTIHIFGQPRFQFVHTDEVPVFLVSVDDSAGPMSYQWLKNGVAIVGATRATYQASPASLSDDRSYFSVVITSGTASFTSSVAQLQVFPQLTGIPIPFFLTPPASQTVTVGDSVTFSVDVTGGVLSWRKDGVAIATAPTENFNIPAVQASDAGQYTVTATYSLNGVPSVVTSAPATLTVNAATMSPVAITGQPSAQAVPAGQIATFSVSATGTPKPTYQWQKDGINIPGATSRTFTVASVQATDAANYRVVVTNAAGSATSDPATLTFAVAVVITQQPAPLTVTAGQNAAFTVDATGTPAPTFQWQKNGVNIPDATTKTLTLSSVQAADVGSYSVVVTNAAGSVNSAAASLTVGPAVIDPGRLTNLSILTPLIAGETMTIGTVLGGAGTSGGKPLLARVAGPSLSQFGITAFLPNPSMTLNNTGVSPTAVVATNSGWAGSSALSNAFAAVGAFAYTSPSSKDSAIFQPSLTSGSYTVQVTDSTGGAGTVITELYDSTPGNSFTAITPRLVNVSVLKSVAAGSSLTAGFVVGGTTNLKVLLRAIGPTLSTAPFNVGGTMADPKLELFNNAANTRIDENNDWAVPVAPLTTTAAQLTATFTSVGAFQLSNPATKDAVLFVTLAPGQYSARLSGADGGGGMVIVEVYEVP